MTKETKLQQRINELVRRIRYIKLKNKDKYQPYKSMVVNFEKEVKRLGQKL